jgi:hypothetical protein
MVGDDAARFEPGQGRLGHSGRVASSVWDSPKSQAAFADGLADEEGTLGFGIAFAVLSTASLRRIYPIPASP